MCHVYVKGHTMPARYNKYDLRESAQLGGSPKQDGLELCTRISHVGRGNQEIKLVYVDRSYSTLFVVNIGQAPLPSPKSNSCDIS